MKRTVLCVSVAVAVTATLVTADAQCRSRTPAAEERRVEKAIPSGFHKDLLGVAFGGAGHARFAFVCAVPDPSPIPTRTPPFARAFLIELGRSRPRIVWNQELATDNEFDDPRVFKAGKGGWILASISSPWPGSVKRFTLRLFRYRGPGTAPVQVLAAEYADGVTVPLPPGCGGPPAFLVSDYTWNHDVPGRASETVFRLCVPTAKGDYRAVNRWRVLGDYSTRQAYGRIRPSLVKRLRGRFLAPARLTSGADQQGWALRADDSHPSRHRPGGTALLLAANA